MGKIVVIGGGPAGIEAARAAAMAGASVTLISNGPIGGRAGWHSLLPSKVWLTAADALGVADSLALLLSVAQPNTRVEQERPLSLLEILTQIRRVKESWNGQQLAELQGLGVQIEMGTAVFATPDSVTINKENEQLAPAITADAFVVATGSVPVFPPHMKPNGKQIIAPRFASGLDTLPAAIMVVGAGATGTEFVYLFNRLDVQVTWVVDEFGVLPGFDREAADYLTAVLLQRGVQLVAGQRVARMEIDDVGVAAIMSDDTIQTAPKAFLAVGRKPDVDGLNLAAAGLNAVTVDEYGRSPQPHIYFAGDVTGPPMVANKGMIQGWIAGQHAAGLAPKLVPPEIMMRAIYTEPQVAQIGQVSGAGIASVQVPATATLKGHLAPDHGGFVKIGYRVDDGRICGATAVASHAADILAPLLVAMRGGVTLDDFGALYGAHPTLTELAFTAARLGANQPTHPPSN